MMRLITGNRSEASCIGEGFARLDDLSVIDASLTSPTSNCV